MGQTVAKLVRYAGGQDVWGGHAVKMFNYTGPTSYDGGTGAQGDRVDCVGVANQTGLRNIDNIIGGVSLSGTYLIVAQPVTAGPTKQYLLRWFTMQGMTEVSDSTNLSGESAIITVIGG